MLKKNCKSLQEWQDDLLTRNPDKNKKEHSQEVVINHVMPNKTQYDVQNQTHTQTPNRKITKKRNSHTRNIDTERIKNGVRKQ